VRTVVAKVPYLTLKAEAGKLGLIWPDMTGLLLLQFGDGTALIVVQPGDHADAERFVDHLVDVGMADGA
jgi:hypothetical protein